MDMDFENIYINEKGEIATPCKFISKEEALKYWPNNQPERSKREDSHKSEMRCSEHCSNAVREVQ